MSDAKRCDRCGTYYDEDKNRQLHLTESTTAIAQITVKTDRNTKSGLPSRQLTRQLTNNKKTKQATTEVDSFDLCDSCFAELLSWWQGGEFTDD